MAWQDVLKFTTHSPGSQLITWARTGAGSRPTTVATLGRRDIRAQILRFVSAALLEKDMSMP